MTTQATDKNSETTRRRAWLASLLMRRESSALRRLTSHLERLRGAPRRWRRRLQRQLAATLTGAALLLAMSGAYAQADPAAPEATITVVNGEVAIANNGKCSLIEAINNANKTTAGGQHADCTGGNPNGADTIVLPNNGDFVLTAVSNTQWGTGLPVLTSTITFNGNGATIRRGGAAPEMAIFGQQNGNVTLNNLTIENGLGLNAGGGIQVLGGSLTLNSSRIRNNTSSSGGGVACFPFYGTPQLTIDNSQITSNVAYHPTADNPNGGGLIAIGCTVTISSSTISGNYSNGEGGGVSISSNDVTISNTTISNNDAKDGGGLSFGTGTISIDHSTITGNRADNGGGLYARNANLSISTTPISNNDALYGGGLFVLDGQVNIDRSTISGNYAYGGGGLLLKDTASVAVVNATISGNNAQAGGGAEIDGPGAALTVTNSTITDNYALYHGGGIDVVNGNLTLNRTLIAGNVDEDSTGGYADEVALHSGTITAGNRNLFGHAGISNADAFDGFLPSGTDITATSNGTAPTPLATILSPLANNGGPTQTHALPANSPARDVAPNPPCQAVPVGNVDQRGQPRNQNGAGGATSNECDIGAFEAEAAAATGAFFLSAATAGTMGGVSFAPADIIKFTPGSGWSMYFDGSDVGITKNVAAFEILADNTILLSLAAGQNVPGVGAVTPQDVLRFTPTQTGNITDGTFEMWVDGSAVGLTTTAEKIDALGLTANGRIAISTTGTLAVPGPNGTLKAQDEDATGHNRTTGAWSTFFNGTAVSGLGAEDVNALWVNPTTGELYISIVGAFNLSGVAGDGKDIVKLTASGGTYTPSLVWDGSAAGFPSTIDGLEMVP